MRFAPALLMMCAACCSKPAEPADPTRDGAVGDATPASDAAPNRADAAPFDPGPEPTAPQRPRPGELTIVQLDLPVGAIPRLGEAAIIVGPDGTLVLLDIGNAGHADDVYDAVVELNTNDLTPARGYPRQRAATEVDWVVITHFHGDHVGAFEDLIASGANTLTVTRGIVHRGYTDLGAAMNEPDYEAFCTAMRGVHAALDIPLCDAATTAPCNPADAVGSYPAADCDGLLKGDLASTADDGAGAPTFIELGGGARLTLVAATAHASDGAAVTAANDFAADDSNQENARSIAGVVSFGRFRYHFGGDMTGSGDPGEPDIESHLVDVAGSRFYGARGVDVVHVHHHVRKTSSNPAFVAAMMPADGRARNAIGGINAAHLNSPHQETLDAWAPALAGGRIWVTTVSATGGSHASMVDADGPVILQTIQNGAGYRVQAAGAALFSLPFPSVRD